MSADKIGINLRSLLDGELALFSGNMNVYTERNAFIDEIERRLMENDWISMSNGTTFEKTFVPSGKGETYVLVFIHPDDSGNDDGILDSRVMTSAEAAEINARLYATKNNSRHWIPSVPKPSPGITHLD